MLTLLVLACNEEDTAGIDLASGALVRARVPWPSGHRPDLATFDVVETVLADRPERDDLAQPEAVSAHGLPRHLGTLHGRRVRQLLHPLAAPMEEHVLGFPGLSAPYWEFRGFRPSLALLVPTKGPVLFRRDGDRSVWIRFGWGRSDNWLPMEDLDAIRALDAAQTGPAAGEGPRRGARIQASLSGGVGEPSSGRSLLQGDPRPRSPRLIGLCRVSSGPNGPAAVR